jgi:hypothetical protein
VKRKGGYLPIAGYAAIGDGRTTALVGADGAIDFLSLPSIHCPTTFGALLDAKKGGSFVLRPSKRFDAERRYLERTNVLETTYTTKSGVVRVTEALTLQNGGLLPWVEVARRVEGLSGDVPMEWRVEPRFDWGRVEPTITRRRGATIAQGEDLHLGIHSFDAGDSLVGEGSIFGSFAARAGSRALLAVCCSTERQPIAIPTRDEVERRLDATTESWRRWLGGWRYDGPWADHVARSALALKLLVYAPRGSIVAAPTTSLPERIGGDRNYDYRYMWVRDTSFSLEALMRLGLPEQVQESFSCLLRSVRTTVPEIHPFYSVEGEPAHRSDVLEHLDGYRGSAPVQQAMPQAASCSSAHGATCSRRPISTSRAATRSTTTRGSSSRTAWIGSRSCGPTRIPASGSFTTTGTTRARRSPRGWRSTARSSSRTQGSSRACTPTAGARNVTRSSASSRRRHGRTSFSHTSNTRVRRTSTPRSCAARATGGPA